jgi:cytochrome b
LSSIRQAGEEVRVRIWDLPVRLFHWLIVVLFAFSWWTAENDHLDWHFLSGYTMLGLLLFRVYWGFVGGGTARFSRFVKGPRSSIAYAGQLFARPSKSSLGHNPIGGWSVLAMLLLLFVQVGLGLFAIDVDGVEGGPLDNLVTFETARRMSHLHGFVFNILLAVIGLHVAAILFYLLYKRQNLIAAMIDGHKRVSGEISEDIRFVSLWWALPGLLVAGLVVLWIVFGHF